jgi:hypothetical protein
MLLIMASFLCLDQPHPAFGGDHLARVGRLARTEVLSLDAELRIQKNHLPYNFVRQTVFKRP